ncbi:orotate phosphoribosyltransferase [Thermobaculum terrenum ATCC BAA-798]|uniref:Orotate phosphoribosyltransferase n=1 Tax=Thermobaculum terrenum (strain ATCC BAA-798 / CCMEE 7001 / YNP1) TaxID=525904 RepID=D1CBW0_THET1|nr:orotate phosphoribosyltransferase [Thermobaculum terrenum]ACZ42275.1 orotate phosphoribosyltransferase [Thermobaculum terrenum ATCC BAA-798]
MRETTDTRELLVRNGALLEGHFLLSSGLHAQYYVEKFRIIEKPDLASSLCSQIVQHFADRNPDVVAGPTTGGAILAFEVARQMGLRSIIAEPAPTGGREFRRGFEIKPGERVLIVDDVMTTGGSVKDTIEAVNQLGGNVVGVGLLVDRSGGKVDLGVDYWSTITLDIPTYDPEVCPLCSAGVPITKRGTSAKVNP